MESIAAINRRIKAIMFPDYPEYAGFSEKTLRDAVHTQLRDISVLLRCEIERALFHSATEDVAETDPAAATSGVSERHDSRGFSAQSERCVAELLGALPTIRKSIYRDVEAIYQGDPAAKSLTEVMLAYPGIAAIIIYRASHALWEQGIPLIPRMMSESAHSETGVDIHPGARIGDGFFIDHATGIVIGETTVIGNNVKIYQGVTLGALSVKKSESHIKRHPTIEDDVTIYAGATILGGKTVIGQGATIGGNVWLTRSVPPNTKVYNSIQFTAKGNAAKNDNTR